MNVGKVVVNAVSAALCAVASSAFADQPFAYPNAGQSAEQQNKDRYECHQWAVSQTGFDPTTAPPLENPAVPPPPPPSAAYGTPAPQRQSSGGLLGIGNGGALQGTGMIGDAATGAALGAAGGALTGDAGKGAAIGALASTALGVFTRATEKPAQPAAPPPQAADYTAYQQQQQNQAAGAYNQRMQQVGQYNRAFGACMSARNYTVN